jgi:hypothetical protein
MLPFVLAGFGKLHSSKMGSGNSRNNARTVTTQNGNRRNSEPVSARSATNAATAHTTSKTMRSYVDIKRESIKATRVSQNRNVYEITFTYDCKRPSRLTVYTGAFETIDDSGNTTFITSDQRNFPAPIDLEISQGMKQVMPGGKILIDVGLFTEKQLKAKRITPVLLEI